MSLRKHSIAAFSIALVLAACGGSQAGGDPVAGEEIFRTKLEDEPGRHACSECHSLGAISPYAPPVSFIGKDAGGRVEGMSAEDYLRQSIIDPSAFIAEGYRDNIMPKVYGEILTEEEIDHLIAYLLTQ
ncbi:MAG: c-type cytochrome [Chloroflexi bacterium]|nr:c-type cytochrome [Chloroflexota bacterium]